MSDLNFNDIKIEETSEILEQAMAIVAGADKPDNKLDALKKLSDRATPDDQPRIGELIEAVLADR